MQLFERVSRYTAADIASLLEQAEEPEAALERLIRDMEGSLLELRCAAVSVLRRQRELEGRAAAPPGAELAEQLRSAGTELRRVTTEMLRLEARVQLARSKRERLCRRGSARSPARGHRAC